MQLKFLAIHVTQDRSEMLFTPLNTKWMTLSPFTFCHLAFSTALLHSCQNSLDLFISFKTSRKEMWCQHRQYWLSVTLAILSFLYPFLQWHHKHGKNSGGTQSFREWKVSLPLMSPQNHLTEVIAVTNSLCVFPETVYVRGWQTPFFFSEKGRFRFWGSYSLCWNVSVLLLQCEISPRLYVNEWAWLFICKYRWWARL